MKHGGIILTCVPILVAAVAAFSDKARRSPGKVIYATTHIGHHCKATDCVTTVSAIQNACNTGTTNRSNFWTTATCTQTRFTGSRVVSEPDVR